MYDIPTLVRSKRLLHGRLLEGLLLLLQLLLLLLLLLLQLELLLLLAELLLLLVELLLLLLHQLLVVAAAAALVQLLARATLLHSLGGLWRDVDGTDGLSVGVQSGARVLAFVAGADGADLQGDLPAVVVVYHRMLGRF